MMQVMVDPAAIMIVVDLAFHSDRNSSRQALFL